MKISRKYSGPDWIIWEGDGFPRSLHSDSVVLFTDTWIDLAEDSTARANLARQLQREGVAESLGDGYRLIEESTEVQGGYYYEDGDESCLVFCESDDPMLDIDATFIEVPYVF